MRAVRFILLFLFYVVAEPLNPVPATAVEVMDGEAESCEHAVSARGDAPRKTPAHAM